MGAEADQVGPNLEQDQYDRIFSFSSFKATGVVPPCLP